MQVVFTVIALALSGIFIQNTITPAIAIGDGCGSYWSDPCYVEVTNTYDF